MKSHEVIKEAVKEPGVKAVAAAMKLSAALVYKWCEPTPADESSREQSGTRNPLDRVRDLYDITKDPRLIRWLCNEAGGFFVKNPPTPDPAKTPDETLFAESRKMVRDFSELLDEITSSVEDDSSVDTHEADRIRQKWEDLKMLVERFVIGCEKGHYRIAKH
jgi:hypothetical protein